MRDIGVRAPVNYDLVVVVVRLEKMHLVAEDLAVAPPVAHKLNADGIEDILAADGLEQRLCRCIGRLRRAECAAENGKRAGTVHGDDFVRLFGDLLIRLLPAYLLVVVAHSFAGVLYSVAVVDKILCRSALAAAVALCAGAVRVGANADDLVVFNLHLQAAAQSAEVALSLFPNSHAISLLNVCNYVVECS